MRAWALPALAALLAAGAPRAAPPNAVVAQLQGRVTVLEPGGAVAAGPARVHTARELQLVHAGDAVRVSAGAALGLVCATDRWVYLRGEREQRLTAELCARGRALPPGTFDWLAPRGGRMRSVEGAMVLERRTRGIEGPSGLAPVLLSPRKTSVIEGRPKIVWTPGVSTTRYELRMQGDVTFASRLPEDLVSCTPAPGGDGQECSSPYPAAAPDLPFGATVAISLGARQEGSGRLRFEEDLLWVRRLPADRASRVSAASRELARLPADGVTRRLLRANLLAANQLYSEAIPLYREALASADVPEVRVTLADAYLAVGLPAPAERSYREALRNDPPAAVAAAARFGLGRIAYARQAFADALALFQQAGEAFARDGFAEEAEAARTAGQEAREKLEEPR